MTTNTDLHGSMPELPNPTYIYHTSEEEGGDDLFEFARSGAVDIDEHYDRGVCADCVRLYTADQMREYARAAIQQAAGAVSEGWKLVPLSEDYFEQAVEAIRQEDWMHWDCQMTREHYSALARTAFMVMDRYNSGALAASPAPPKQQPDHLAGGECGGVQVPLTDEQAALVWPIAQDKWNACADGYNQWDGLGRDEMSILIVREAELQLGIAPRPSAPTGQIEEQAVFEEWLRRVCPSGDVTSVQEQWLASSDYEDWAGQINPDSAGLEGDHG